MLVTAIAYLVTLYFWLGLRVLTDWLVLLSTAGIVVLVYLLCNAVLLRSDRRGPVPSLVLVSVLAVILGSTVAWPVLGDSSYKFQQNPPLLYVNVIGKWIYLVTATITIIGLCVMVFRVIGVLSAGHINYLKNLRSQVGTASRTAGVLRSPKTARRVWRAASLAVIVVTLFAVVPALIAQSQIRYPHAIGLVPPNLAFYSGLYRALPQYLNWLLLALAVTVLVSISRSAHEPGKARRIAARRIAIPVMMLILFSVHSYSNYAPWVFSNYTWLYLPITPIAGLMILNWLVLPEKLTELKRTLAPGRAIKRSLSKWRAADFADSQRQKLMSDGDDLRDSLLKDGQPGYYKTLDSLANAQNQLASLHDRSQQEARAYLTQAFDHQGELPDLRTARRGAVLGALLGLVPACVLLLAAQPVPSWSGYPVLDFFSYTAWILFMWPALGWTIGYFLPFIRGRDGITKALWVYAAVAASLPMNLLWLDGHDWAAALIYYLELFAFLLILSVILCDLMALKSAGLSISAWAQVHNWRFLAAWATAVLAAIGTAGVTFATSVATDLGQQTVTVITGQGTPSNSIPEAKVSNP